MQRRERIRDLAGREYARRESPQLLAAIGDALNLHLSEENILPWEMSKKLRDEIQVYVRRSIQERRGIKHLVFSPSDRERFDAEFLNRVSGFGVENVVLSLGRFTDLALVQISPSLIANHFYELWKIGDTVVISSADLSRGLLADCYPDDPVEAFEIAGWGEAA